MQVPFLQERERAMPSGPNAADVFSKAIAAHQDVIRGIEQQQPVLLAIAQAMMVALHAGGKILWCGNGGSAADAQHMAAEIVCRYRQNRRGLASIALTTDTSILTAVANDFGFESVFARQVEALGNAGDVMVGISTSGNSPNVVAALEQARALRLITVAFTGEGGGKSAAFADHLFAVESRETARIQEAHSLAGHMLCDWIEIDCIHRAEVQKAEGAK
jgi:D-sedoheptulose 7-phosphate isomerase